MKNNGLAIVEKHNALLTQIRKVATVEDMRQLFADVKEFIAMYEEIHRPEAMTGVYLSRSWGTTHLNS